MIFGEYSDIVENDILTMQRLLDISRVLYSEQSRYVIMTNEMTRIHKGEDKQTRIDFKKHQQQTIQPNNGFTIPQMAD